MNYFRFMHGRRFWRHGLDWETDIWTYPAVFYQPALGGPRLTAFHAEYGEWVVPTGWRGEMQVGQETVKVDGRTLFECLQKCWRWIDEHKAVRP